MSRTVSEKNVGINEEVGTLDKIPDNDTKDIKLVHRINFLLLYSVNFTKEHQEAFAAQTQF